MLTQRGVGEVLFQIDVGRRPEDGTIKQRISRIFRFGEAYDSIRRNCF
jgi:hypothetical protein